MLNYNSGISVSIKNTSGMAIQRTKVAAENIRILSYNVHGIPTANDFDCDNLIEIGKQLGKMRANGTAPEIVAIQEGFHWNMDKLIELSGYPYAEQGPVGGPKEITSGLWILSEYPIDPVENVIYKNCVSWDCFSNKGIQHAIIEIPMGDTGYFYSLEIYNTHMNAHPSGGDFLTAGLTTDTIRALQLEQLFQYIFRKTMTQLPAVLLGDFNFRPGDSNWNNFTAWINSNTSLSFVNAAQKLLDKIPNVVDHQFVRQATRYGAPDYILRPIKYDKVFDLELSDHHGILVEYALERN